MFSAPGFRRRSDHSFRNTLFTKTAGSNEDVELTSQAEALEYRAITLDILTPQVVEQTAATTDHFEQAAPGEVIFFMGFEMLGEVDDALGQNGNLDFG